MGGLFPAGTGDYVFLIVNSPDPKVGFFIWEGVTVPDKFAQGDGHVYEMLWDEQRVEFRLIQEKPELRLLVGGAIHPVDIFVMTAGDPQFYLVRNRLREIGREACRTDFEGFIKERAPYLSVGGQNFLPTGAKMPDVRATEPEIRRGRRLG